MRHLILAGLSLVSLAACSAQTEGDTAPEADTPTASANADTTAAAAIDAQPAYGEGDALVPGTEYNATTILKCGFDNKPPTQECNAGIKRNWGNEGEHLIEVVKPDGRKRAIFLRGTEPYGADSAQADGSAGWDFKTSRKEDMVTVRFGPETYVLVDAMVTGG